MKSNALLRIRILTGLTVLFVFILIGKLYLVQIVSGPDFRLKAEHQYVQPNQVIFDRGSIFFANKDGTELAAATLKTGFTLSMSPKLVGNAEATYQKLSQYLTLDRATFLAKSMKKDDPYEEIAKRVDDETGKKIEALKLGGLSLYRDRWRVYPAGGLASAVVGFIAYKGNDLGGRYGLESYYDDTLRRTDNGLYVNFFAQIFGGFSNPANKQKELTGDIYTTIEPTVEDFLEKQLVKVENTWHSKESGAIIMNPSTGEIYAMASYPSFDQNKLGEVANPSIFANPNVEDVHEMGSIIKPLTMAVGIDAGAVTPDTFYDDKGFITINNAKISNFDGKGRGHVNMQTVLNDSLNTGAAFIEQSVGNALFGKYFKSFGLGDETGIDLPNEAHGLIDNLNSPRDVEYATASFGQGIAMSPIETTRALAALANGGLLVTPHVVQRIDYQLGFSKKITPDPGTPVIKKSTAETVTKMLVKVVDNALLGGTVKLKNYSVAAKTGTAQIAKPGGGGYYGDRYLHSFFGYFPAYNPKFIIFLYTVEPQNASFASHTLTQPFIDSVKFLIHYYEIPPDR